MALEATQRLAAPLASVELETADSVNRFAAAEWDGLLGSDDFFRHGYLAALEASGLDCQFHYAVLRADGALRGLGFGCLMRFNLGRWRPRVWLGGSPVNLGEPFAFAPGSDTPWARHRLQEALFAKARQAGALYFLLRDLPPPGSGKPGMEISPALQLSPMPLHSTAVLPLDFPDFESYLASLEASRRKSARRDMRVVEAAGLSASTKRLSPALAPRLLELWLNLYYKYRDPDQIRLTEGYFRALAERPEAVFLSLWQGERLVAFDLCLRQGELLSAVFSGLDPQVAGKLPVHRYMGLEIVRHAIALGCGRVDFGISNEASKVRLGCQLQLLYGYGRLVSGALQGVGAGRLVRRLLAAPASAAAQSASPTGQDTRPAPPAPAVLRGRQRVVVIGAGLRGLAAAARLASEKHVELVVLEQTGQPGGVCRTASFGRGREGFIAGCNLFSPRFFSLLAQCYGIRLPSRRALLRTVYQGQFLGARDLLGHLVSRQGLGTLARLAGGWLRNGEPLAEWLGRGQVLGDLVLLPFMLHGQAPWLWPVRAGLAKLRAMEVSSYPVAGVSSIPRALERVISQGSATRIVYHSPVQGIETCQGRVIGVRTPEAEWPAEVIVSSLPQRTTRALLSSVPAGASDEVGRPAGLSALAVFLLLDAAFSLPRGCYGLSFVEPDMLGQLRELFAGRVPVQPCFELICPDMARGRPSAEGWRVTLLTTCPATCGTAEAELLWSGMASRLEQSLPGLARAIRWSRLVPPGEYGQLIGCDSQLSPFADPPPRAVASSPLAEGLYLAQGAAETAAGETLLALRAGLACAEHAATHPRRREAQLSL
jgi:uncharacterized protein